MQNVEGADNFEHGKFVNRSIELGTFSNLIEAPEGTKLPVLCFHGVGGVGKSWLRCEFEAVLGAHNKRFKLRPIRFAAVDFVGDKPSSPALLLHLVASGLAARGVALPEFFAAYSLYARKSGNTTLLGAGTAATTRSVTLLEALISSYWPLLWPLLAVGIVLKAHLGSLEQGIVLASGTAVGCLIKMAIDKMTSVEKQLGRFHKAYAGKSEQEIKAPITLMQALANDLNRERRAWPWHGKASAQCRTVIFFDTLEGLDSTASQTSGHEAWIADLARLLDRTLVVLTGHNRALWEKYNPPKLGAPEGYWGKNARPEDDATEAWTQDCGFASRRLLQYKLRDLADEHAREMLERYGITEPDLRDRVLQECVESEHGGFHPFSLRLCLLTIEDIRGGEHKPLPSAQKFSDCFGDHGPIVARYVKYLKSQEKDEISEWKWTEMLAFTPQFDGAAALVCFLNGQRPRATKDDQARLKALMGRPYFSKLAQSDGWFVMHGNLKNHIIDSTPAKPAQTEEAAEAGTTAGTDAFSASEAHAFWLGYWESRQVEKWKGQTPSRTDKLARFAWLHRWHVDPEVAWQEWKQLISAARSEGNSEEYKYLAGWWDATGIKRHVPKDEYTASILLCINYEIKDGPFGVAAESWREVRLCFNRVIAFYERSRDREKWAAVQGLKASVLFNVAAHRAKNLAEIARCCQDALSVWGDKGQHWRPEAQNAVNSLGAPRCLCVKGQVIRAARGESAAKLREALACYEAAIPLCLISQRGDTGTLWAQLQYSKGQALFDLRDDEPSENLRQALECCRLAFTIFTVDDVNWADTHILKGYVLAERPDGDRTQNLRSAIECWELARPAYQHQEDRTVWAAVQECKARAYSELEEWQLAFDCAEAVLQEQIRIGDEAEIQKARDLRHLMQQQLEQSLTSANR